MALAELSASAPACWRASRPAIATSAWRYSTRSPPPGVSFHRSDPGAGSARQPSGGRLAWQARSRAARRCSPASVPARQRAELWEWTLMPGERYDSADAEGWAK
ncbi:hypothetical protein M8494_15725 [Serratia ureilytica]